MRRSRDPPVITAVEEHAADAIPRYAAGGMQASEAIPSSRCGDRESDPSLMLGVVILVAANTLVVAALIVGLVWMLA
jgi:hypothetical protein